MRTAVAVVAFLLSLFSGVLPAQNPPAPKSVVIFVDDFHIDFQNTPKLRTGFKQATERLLAAGRAVAIVSDGPSSVSTRPTNDRTALSQIANRISGAGLKPTETANPTPTVAADLKRREATAEETLQSILRSPGIDAILYVTERQMQPIATAIPIVMTRPEGMEAAVAELLSR